MMGSRALFSVISPRSPGAVRKALPMGSPTHGRGDVGRARARATGVLARLSPDERDAVRRAWATLLPESDALADSITLALFEQDPGYMAAGSDIPSIVRSSTREHIRLGLRRLSGMPDSPEATTDVWRRTGRERARQGIPMELVLKAYTLGSRTLWEELAAAVAEKPSLLEARLLLVAGQRLWQALDTQNTILVDAYRRETARMQQRDLSKILSVLDGLRDGHGADPQFAADARATLGLATSQAIACAVGAVSDLGEPPLAAPEDTVDHVTTSSYWHVRDGVQFGLLGLGPGGTSAVADAVAPRATGPVGIASSADGLASFASAYRTAARAAATVATGDRLAVVATDRLPAIVVSADDEIGDLIEGHAFGDLVHQPAATRDTLLRTLAHVLVADGSPTNAAKLLYCHRNTVIYRMRQVEDLTGRSTADPDDRLILTLALVRSGHWSDAVGAADSRA